MGRRDGDFASVQCVRNLPSLTEWLDVDAAITVVFRRWCTVLSRRGLLRPVPWATVEIYMEHSVSAALPAGHSVIMSRPGIRFSKLPTLNLGLRFS